MNPSLTAALVDAFDSPGAIHLGSVLLHFVWQGILLGGFAGMLLWLLSATRPQARYLALVAMLLAMAACPVVTFCVIMKPAPRTAAIVQRQIAVPSAPATDPPSSAVIVAPAAPTMPTPPAVRRASGRPVNWLALRDWALALRAWVLAQRCWLVPAWLAGVALLTLRLIIGLACAERARRRGVAPIAAAIEQTAAVLARRMGIRHAVRVLESTLAEVPTLVGWLRPVILLPASVLTNLSAAELEAILAHELAHIRRHDYLVNFLQTVVETLLFYHPAIWWLSRRIREERELCCDDMAIAFCGDRLVYARALATLEEFRAAPRWAMAARGGNLLARIHRILGRPESSGGDSIAMATVGALLLLAALAVMQWRTFAAAQEPARPAKALPAVAAPPVFDSYEFKLLNSKGEPLPNTTVTPWQIGYNQDGGVSGSFGFGDKPVAPLVTDSAGEFTFVILADSPAATMLKNKTVRSIGFHIDHPQHPIWMDYAPIEGNREIVLADGQELAVRVRREGESAVPRHLYPSPAIPGWSEKDGVVTLRRVDLTSTRKPHWLRIVQVPPGGPAWFSDLIDLDQPQDLRALQTVLKPGVRLAGRLSENVPRPVKEGRVVAAINDGFSFTSWTQMRRGWNWSAVAEIAPDGTFVFESLPADTDLQFITRCEGWLSVPPTLAELEAYAAENRFALTPGDKSSAEGAYHAIPRLLRLTSGRMETVIPMRETLTCEVTVVDTAGQPVPQAQVHFWPNQYWYHQGSQIVGTGVDALKLLTAPPDPPGRPFAVRMKQVDYFDKVTDEQGRAVVANLPNRSPKEPGAPREFGFSVHCAGYELAPGQQLDNEHGFIAKLLPGQPNKITVRLQRQ